MSTEPQPLSMTASGGQMIQTRTLRIPIVIVDCRFAIVDLRLSLIKVRNIPLLPTAHCLLPEKMICRLQDLQPQVSRVTRPIFQEPLNRLAGISRPVAGEGSGYPASGKEDIAGTFYLFQQLQGWQDVVFRPVGHRGVMQVSQGLQHPRLMFTAGRIAEAVEEFITDSIVR